MAPWAAGRLDLLLATQAEFWRETVASLSSFTATAWQAQDPAQLMALQAGLWAGMAERSLLLSQRAMLLALGTVPEAHS